MMEAERFHQQIIDSLDHQSLLDAMLRGFAPNGPLQHIDLAISAVANERYVEQLRAAAKRGNDKK